MNIWTLAYGGFVVGVIYLIAIVYYLTREEKPKDVWNDGKKKGD